MDVCHPINATLACASEACVETCLGFPACGPQDVIADALTTLSGVEPTQAALFASLACGQQINGLTLPGVAEGLNSTYLLFSAYLVFFMQARLLPPGAACAARCHNSVGLYYWPYGLRLF